MALNIRFHHLGSDYLSEPRGVTVFLPAWIRPGGRIAIVYCADGQAVPELAASVASAIQQERLPPVVLVGVHSEASHRAEEYLHGVKPSWFEAHQQFFAVEVPHWLTLQYGISAEREFSAVFGYSNGSAFAMTMGTRHRDRFGTVIAFSVPRASASFRIRDSVRPVPRYYLAAGKLERGFRKVTHAIAKTLEKHSVEHTYREPEAGHDFGFWIEEFPLALQWAFRGGRGERQV